MPQAIPIVATWVASFVGVVTGGAVIMGVTSAYLVASLFVYAASSLLLNAAMKALTPRPKGGAGNHLEVNYQGTTEPRRIIYGRQMVGGMHVIPPFCTGTDGEMLHMVLALAGHEVDAITDMKFNRAGIGHTAIGAVTGSANDGLVNLPGLIYHNVAWIRRYRGTSTQTVDWILNNSYASAFPTSFRGRGIAYVAVQFKYDQNHYSNGVPNVTAYVQGKRVYDPRKDSTNGGSGAHRYTDSTTWEFTSNPALCVRDFLVNDVGFGNDEIDDPLVIAAANYCEQTVAIPVATIERRYNCDISLFASTDWEDNLRLLVDTMHGRVLYRDGKWRIHAGKWDTPVAGTAITKDDWVSPTVMRSSVDRDERWNAMRAFYVDPNRDWQRVECFPRRNTSYETQDGGERIWEEAELPGCLSEYQAQRQAEFYLRQSRNQTRISGQLRPEFIKLAPWETVTVTDDEYGWSSKTFRVISMEMGANGSVAVVLVEDGSAAWDDLLESEYNGVVTAPTIDPGATRPGTPLSLSAVGGRGAINFTWQPGSDDLRGQTYRLLESVNCGDAAAGSEVWRGLAQQAMIGKTDTTTRFYWVQGIVGSYASRYFPNTFGYAAVASTQPADGVPGTYSPLLELQAQGLTFRFSGSHTNIGVNTIGFDALLYGMGGTAGFRAHNYRADGTGIASYDLSGARNTGRGLHVNSFQQSNSTAWCTVVGSITGGYTDRVTVVRLMEGAGGSQGSAGLDAIVGVLTNEAHSLPASYNGFIPSYAGAVGEYQIYEGVNRVAINSITFTSSAVFPSGMTCAITAAGSYGITAGIGAGDAYGAQNLRGVYKGTIINKLFTVAKALGGVTGAPGSAGLPGAIGPPGSNLLSNGDMTHINSVTGLLAGWTGAHSYIVEGGPSSVLNALIVTSQNMAIENAATIPVDPYADIITIGIWGRSVTSGSFAYLYAAPHDARHKFIPWGAEDVTVLSRAFIGAAQGATSVQVSKPSLVDSGHQGYNATPANNMLLYYDSVFVYAHRGTNFATVSAINTTVSNSYDTFTVSALPVAVASGTEIAIGGPGGWGGGTYVYMNGGPLTLSSAWTYYEWDMRGLGRAYKRDGDSPANTWRFGTQFMRFGVLANYGGVNAQNQFANAKVVKVSLIGGTICRDEQMIFGAGNWITSNVGAVASLQTYFWASSGGTGGAIEFLHLNSSNPYTIGQRDFYP